MKGDIVLVQFPYSDSPQRKLRPALILYEDQEEHEITIAYISSRIPETLSPCDVLVKTGTPSFVEAGLKYDSVIKLNKLATIKDYLIEGLLGVADDALMAQVDAAIEACLKFKGRPKTSHKPPLEK